MKVNMISETTAGFEGNGVHSAFLDVLNALEGREDIEVVINSKEKSDVIHAHTIGPLYLASVLGKKKKTLVTAHVIPDSMVGSIILSKYWLPLYTWYLKFTYSRASTVLAVSPTVKKELDKMNIKSKIVFVPNSIDRSTFSKTKDYEVRKKYDIGESDFVVLCVGQIQTRKGVGDFIETAKQLPNLKFIWVGHRPFGKITAGYNETEEMVKNAPENVVFTGYVPREEMPKYYRTANIFFFPSFQENHPVAVIEAASCGLPLVLRDINEYKDTFFEDYLSADSIEGFVKVIKDLRNDKAILSEYTERSEHIADEYDVKNVVEKLVAEYKEVFENSKK